MVSTARAWLPGESSWPLPVNGPVGAPQPGEPGPVAGPPHQQPEASVRDGSSQARALHVDDRQIRGRVAAALAGLAALVEPSLTAAVRRARQAWDQADALVVFDARALAEVAALRRWLATAVAAGGSEGAAVALEGLLALDAAVALIRLFERRLAALLRLQLRSDEPELLPRERPFLDLAAALREAEQAWR
jgi:hypothetical protein